jgi:hypothetical protein
MVNLNTSRIEIIAILFCISFLALLVRLILKKQLREEYIIVWIVVLLLLSFFVICRSELDRLAALAGIFYSPSLLFLLFFGGLLIFCLHLSIVVSKQSRNIKELSQKIALMEQEIKQL